MNQEPNNEFNGHQGNNSFTNNQNGNVNNFNNIPNSNQQSNINMYENQNNQTPNNTMGNKKLNTGFNERNETDFFEFPLYNGGLPYILDEFGGIKWVVPSHRGNNSEAWGYGSSPKTEEEFFRRLSGQVKAILELDDYICGYCYTQLTDVEQEQNGIYNYDRTPKFDIKKLYNIFSKKPY